MGPPPRGWYQAQFFMDKHANNNEVIKRLISTNFRKNIFVGIAMTTPALTTLVVTKK